MSVDDHDGSKANAVSRDRYQVDDLDRCKRQDRRAIIFGTIVTAVGALIFFVLPELFQEEVEAFKLWYWEQTGRRIERDNPLGPLRFGGGVLGGAIAGWYTSEIGSGGVNGAKAAIYGIGLMIVLVFTGMSGAYLYLGGVQETPFLFAATLPVLYALFLLPPHLIGGAIAGTISYRLRQRL